MRALWLASLLLCFILSAVNAGLCPTGCKTCDYLIKCTSCEKGYVLYDSSCGKCAPGCDRCKVVKTQGNQYWTECTGSCQTACTKCNSDYTCGQCSTGYGVMNGQCQSCQGDCDKCYFTPKNDGTSAYWIKCTGSCKGGCDACSNGDTCTRCRSGYVLNNGVCYACNGCSQCTYVQATSTSYRTECVANPSPVSDNTNNTNNSGNSPQFNPLPFVIGGGLLLIGGVIFFLKKQKDQKDRDMIQRDYLQAMAAEKQRQAVANPPQYYPPQGYPQAYPQTYPQGYPQQPAQPRY